MRRMDPRRARRPRPPVAAVRPAVAVRPPVGAAVRIVRRACVAVAVAAVLGAASANLAPMRELLANGHYNAAVQLEGPNLVERFPFDPEARYLYARAAWLTGDMATARAEVDHALELADTVPPPAPYLHLDGLILAEEGDALGALRALEAAFRGGGAYEHAMDWGLVAWRFGEFDVALTAYAEAARTAEGARSPWPHLNRGRILARVGRDDAAIVAFETAIEVFEATDPGGARPPSPAYVEAFYRLGRLREAAGDLARAEQDYRAARSIDPNYTPAARALDELTRRID